MAELIRSLLIALLCALAIRRFGFMLVRVQGESMRDTLRTGDRLYVSILSARFRRGDVVICRYPRRKGWFVKRLIALPGDTVSVTLGEVSVNGQPVDAPWPARRALYTRPELRLGEGEYYVLGDNRRSSRDSHSPEVGPVGRPRGVVRAVIWPPRRIGRIGRTAPERSITSILKGRITMSDQEETKLTNAEGEKAEPNEPAHHLLEMHESEKKPLLSDKAKKEIIDWIRSLAIAVVAVLIIRSFLFTMIRVDGPSMSDTLLNGDRLFVTVADIKLHGPSRFDVVILHYPNRTENFVKRVIGVPGDTIVVENGVLSINGVTYDEPYLTDERTARFDRSSFTVELGEDEYFVMGDNRDNSNDSRSVGVIHRNMFIGKVRQIFWPLTRWDTVEGGEVYNVEPSEAVLPE